MVKRNPIYTSAQGLLTEVTRGHRDNVVGGIDAKLYLEDLFRHLIFDPETSLKTFLVLRLYKMLRNSEAKALRDPSITQNALQTLRHMTEARPLSWTDQSCTFPLAFFIPCGSTHLSVSYRTNRKALTDKLLQEISCFPCLYPLSCLRFAFFWRQFFFFSCFPPQFKQRTKLAAQRAASCS